VIRDAGYPLHLLSQQGYLAELAGWVNVSEPDFIVCDKYRYDVEELITLKRNGAPLMTYDHFGSHRHLSDYPINAVVSEPGNPYSGLAYMVLPSPPVKTFREISESIFVCFGGFDYLDLTLRVVKLLAEMDVPLPINAVVGKDYANTADLSKYAGRSSSPIRIHQQPADFQDLMADSDIAFVAGGLTFYQALSLGLATAVICQYKHQWDQVNRITGHHAFIALGMGNAFDERCVATTVLDLMANKEVRRDYYQRGRSLVDGKGLMRVVKIIREHLGL
jgi:spore coat polysaccharide biosynthesis predicted glycosyltransferase SpsG